MQGGQGGSEYIQINVTSGQYATVTSNLAYPGATINAIGYNPFDNYIYGAVGPQTTQNILQISALASTVIFQPGLNVPYPLRVADFDGSGNYWGSSTVQLSLTGTLGSTYWTRVNLAPGTSNYGQQIESGKADFPATLGMYDWVYLPEGGQSMVSQPPYPRPPPPPPVSPLAIARDD